MTLNLEYTMSNNNVVLNTEGPCNYTELEMKLFSMLSFKDKISSKEIAEKYFGDDIFGKNNVLSRMRLMNEKMDQNCEKYLIIKSPRRGPRPALFWLERRPKTKPRPQIKRKRAA
jgi:hypothetical protein